MTGLARTTKRLFIVLAAAAVALLAFAAPSSALASPPHGTVGVAYSYDGLSAITSLGCSIAASQLPPGLTFDESTHVISGTPTATGTFSNINMVCGNTTEATIEIVIDPAVEAPLADPLVVAGLLALAGAGGLIALTVRRRRPTAGW